MFIPGLSVLHLPGLCAAVLVFGAIMYGSDSWWPQSEIRVCLFILFFISIGMVYAPNTRAVYNLLIDLGVTIFASICAAYWVINSRENLANLAKVWIVAHLCLGVFVLTHGGVGPGDFIGDENDVALVLAMSGPLLWYFASCKAFGVWRWASYATFVIVLVGVIVTGSRGGFLALVAALVSIWLYSHQKTRLIRIGVVVAIFGLAIGSQL